VSEELDVAEFAREFQTFMHAMARLAPREEPSPLYQRLAEHLGRPPTGLPVVTEAYEPYEHANVQVGLDAYLAEAGRGTELLGISGGGREHQGFNDIVEAAGRHHQYDVGAVDYVTVPVSVAAERTCVSFGLYLISSGQDHIAVLLRAGSRRTGDPRVQLEVLAADADIARRFLGEVRDLVARHNTFRGQVLSFEPHAFGHGLGPLRFHPRPQVPATDVVLPAGVLAAVHRQSAGMARHRDRLLAAGHHLKRGILLFGPPGTGKTHTIRYLMGQMPEATVVILTGIGLQFVREACALARLVPPALVVLEDVDLVAQERSWVPDGGQPIHCCSRSSTRWTEWPATRTSPSCSPRTALTSSNRRSPSAPGGSTWRYGCRCPTRPAGGGCCPCTATGSA
jgi:cell division protease FtsH